MPSGTHLDEFAVGGQEQLRWGGLNTAVKDPRFLALGQTPDSKNWITGRDGDHIELRRGQALLGNTRRNGGHITGLGVGRLSTSQVPFFTANRSVYYYNSTTQDTQEIATANLLPIPASGEDVSIMPYQNLAGSFVYLTSPHSSIYKIPVANPANVVDQLSVSYRFGSARIDQNRMIGLQRYGANFAADVTSSYLSNSDSHNYSFYQPVINANLGTGDGATTAFSANLPGQGAKATFFSLVAGGAISAGTGISNIVESGAILTVTSNAHGRSVGDLVMMQGVTSTGTTINGNIAVVLTVPDVNTVTISVFSAISSVVYGSGGTLYLIEAFTDGGEGKLTSNLGGVGTINYATGAVTLNFNTPPTTGVQIAGDFYAEDASQGGICDFSFAATNPSIGQAYQFSETGGGLAMASAGFQGVQYILHQVRSWIIGIPTDASASYNDATNNQYWSHIGIPYIRAAYPTGDGILYLDNINPAQPKFSILEIPAGSTNLTVVPTWISEELDLSEFDHSSAVSFRWGEYDILACKALVNGSPQTFNSVFLIRNQKSGLWNLLDYSVTCLDEFLGALLSGDSLSPNLFLLFSGLDDDGTPIDNHWNTAYTDFGMEGLKDASYLTVEGLIQRDQQIQVGLSSDVGPYTALNIQNPGLIDTNGAPITVIDGRGSYVDSSSPVGIGTDTLGSTVLGGGVIEALPFSIDIPIYTDQFDFLSVQFKALQIGWAQINRIVFKNINLKSRRLLSSSEGVI